MNKLYIQNNTYPTNKQHNERNMENWSTAKNNSHIFRIMTLNCRLVVEYSILKTQNPKTANFNPEDKEEMSLQNPCIHQPDNNRVS